MKIAKQTFLSILFTNKFNLYLIQIFQYIQFFNLQIFHKFNKIHLILNALFQFFNEAFSNNIKSFNAFHVNVLHKNVKYTATIIKLSKEFKKYLQDKYQKNSRLQKILDVIINNNKLLLENKAKLLYKSEKNLLYQIINNKNCFCIL